MAKYSVKVSKWVEQEDDQLKPVRIREIQVVKDGLSWEEAKELQRNTPNSEIFPMAH